MLEKNRLGESWMSEKVDHRMRILALSGRVEVIHTLDSQWSLSSPNTCVCVCDEADLSQQHVSSHGLQCLSYSNAWWVHSRRTLYIFASKMFQALRNRRHIKFAKSGSSPNTDGTDLSSRRASCDS